MSGQLFKLLPSELRLETSLKCGQSFRWIRIDKKVEKAEDKHPVVFRCALKNRVVTLSQTEAGISYSAVYPPDSHAATHDDTHDVLHDYLNLSVDLPSLYKQWSLKDPHFRKISVEFLGLRMLRQDPFENLISFICSSNNNISRITQMVQNLCKHYGKEIATIDDHTYYDFPLVKDLLHPSLTEELRDLGFGYRAKFIAATAQQLASLPDDYLHSLRSASYEDAHASLLQFMGVGAKVADCVCLMSLDKHAVGRSSFSSCPILTRDRLYR